MDKGGAWGRMAAAASLRGLPRGRLSARAGLSVDVAPTLLEGGEGPCSEGSTVLSSDDILVNSEKKDVIWQVTKARRTESCRHLILLGFQIEDGTNGGT